MTFYAAGNEANGNGIPTGDYIYTKTAQSSTGTPPPECEPESISTDTISKTLELKLGESGTVTATVAWPGDCEPEGAATVNAAINKAGKKRVTINRESAMTDENGQATFTITAGEKKGNAKVKFTVEGSKGKIHKTIVRVKIRKNSLVLF